MGYQDGRIAHWSAGKDGRFEPRSVWEIKGHDGPISCLAFDPGIGVLASGGYDRSVKTWNLSDGARKMDLGQFRKRVTSVAFSLEGDLLVASFFAPDGAIQAWHWPSGKEMPGFQGHAGWVCALAFLPDRRRTLVSSAADRVVKVWDVETRQERFNLQAGASIFHSVAISPDGNTIAAGSRYRTIHIFHAANKDDVKKAQSQRKP